jgi:hypothetical protein
LVLRLNRQAGTLVWANRFDGETGAPHLRATVRHAGSGQVWITQPARFRTFLTRLETATGQSIDSALLSTSPELDAAIEDAGINFVQRLPDGSFLAYGAVRAPGNALTPWAGRLAGPESGVRGDLSTAIEVTHVSLERSQLTASFAYTGDAPVSGALAYMQLGDVSADGMLPYSSTAQEVTCVVVGTGSCTAVPAPSGIRALLDLQPGASARITTQIWSFGKVPIEASAEIYAPYGLFETDLVNNRQRVRIGDRLFSGDFEWSSR